MRIALAILLLAAASWTQEEAAPAPPPLEEVVRLLGGDEAWGELPEWRQAMILDRYRRFLEAPEERQAEIRERGLREYLIKPIERFGPRGLPPSLREDVRRLPPEVRGLASKLVVIRLRQLRLDRHLELLPPDRRLPMFRALFPEPFDQAAAGRARAELDRLVVRSLAARARERVAKAEEDLGRSLTEGERRGLVQEMTREDDERLVERVRKEVLRFPSRQPGRMREALDRERLFLLERLHLFATPRQRELIRYALAPDSCPLLDLAFLGPAPEDRAEYRRWEQDRRTLGRVALLSEAGFPPDQVLHLASATSPEELFRALQAVRGHRGMRGRAGK